MKPHVAVVHNDSVGSRALADALQREGFHTKALGSASELLRDLPHTPYDLVLTQSGLPDMDGIRMLEEIRRIRPGMPVVILTDHGSLKATTEALRLGADDYILAPCDPANLRVRLQSVLHSARQRIERLKCRERMVAAEVCFDLVEQAQREFENLDAYDHLLAMSDGVSDDVRACLAHLAKRCEFMAGLLNEARDLASSRHGQSARIAPLKLLQDVAKCAVRNHGAPVRINGVPASEHIRMLTNPARLAHLFAEALEDACEASGEGHAVEVQVRTVEFGVPEFSVESADEEEMTSVLPAIEADADMIAFPVQCVITIAHQDADGPTNPPAGECDPRTARGGAPRGAGLVAAADIARSLGGSLRLRRAEDGRATTEILLPALRVHSLNAPYVAVRERGGAPVVLIIHDDEPTRRLANDAVASRKMIPVNVSNGAEAFQLAADTRQPIDLVLLNASLPGMKEAEAYQRLRGLRAEVPIVLIPSGSGSEWLASAVARDPLAQVVEKPFSRMSLLDAIARTTVGGKEKLAHGAPQ